METSLRRTSEQEHSKLHIRLLGEFRLIDDSGTVAEIHQDRLRSMLAYLIIRCRSAQPRSRLAYLFWPDTNDKQARTNLRHLLFLLRQALPDAEKYLDITGKTVQWHCNAPCMVDVIEFEAAIAQARLAEERDNVPNMRRWLEQAVDLYTGELLPDFYDDWILLERERLSHLFAQALSKLIRVSEGMRDYDSAITVSERLLRHDPLCETTHRLLMRLHAVTGNRADSLRVYQICAVVLEQELGVGPSTETKDLYRRLLQEIPTEDLTAKNSQKVDEPGDDLLYSAASGSLKSRGIAAPLVGRFSEWQDLTTAWRQTQDGDRQVVFIGGESGIGKTKLADALVKDATLQGFAAATARASAAQEPLAFGPVIQWLRSESISANLNAIDTVWLIEAARLLPELSRQRPDLPDPEPLREGWQRQRLYEALAQIVLAVEKPILLYIDNMQWCDPETLSWLHFLLRYTDEAPFMLLGTVRSEDVGQEHPLATWRTALRLDNSHVDSPCTQYREIDLGRLDVDETAELAAAESGKILSSDESRWTYDETEGHPLFIVEMARSHRSWTKPGTAGRSLASKSWNFGDSQLPDRVLALLDARVLQLSPETKALADAAAMLGREFTYAALAAITDLDEEQLVSGLEELLGRRIVFECGTESYTFSHGKLRSHICAGLSRERRRLIHRRAANAPHQLYLNAPNDSGERVMDHFQQDGRQKEKPQKENPVRERSWSGIHDGGGPAALFSGLLPERRRGGLQFGMPGVPGLNLDSTWIPIC